jgi:hypothetical protein
MRFFRLTTVVLALTVFGAITAQATIAPVGGVNIDIAGQTFQVLTNSDGLLNLTTPIDVLVNDTMVAEVTMLSAQMEKDPFIAYGIAVTNFAPVTLPFSFNFFDNYTGGPYNSLNSSHSSSVTDSGANPDGIVVVTPVLTRIHTPYIDGVNVAGAALGAGCTETGPPGFSQDCNTNVFVTVPVSTMAAGTFGVQVAFNLSGNDIYTSNGRVQLNRVSTPEPSSFLLLGLGLSALFVIRRRSHA